MRIQRQEWVSQQEAKEKVTASFALRNVFSGIVFSGKNDGAVNGRPTAPARLQLDAFLGRQARSKNRSRGHKKGPESWRFRALLDLASGRAGGA